MVLTLFLPFKVKSAKTGNNAPYNSISSNTFRLKLVTSSTAQQINAENDYVSSGLSNS